MIEQLHAHRHLSPEFVDRQQLLADVLPHGEIRGIELQDESAATIASYSTRIASAMACQYLSVVP